MVLLGLGLGEFVDLGFIIVEEKVIEGQNWLGFDELYMVI